MKDLKTFIFALIILTCFSAEAQNKGEMGLPISIPVNLEEFLVLSEKTDFRKTPKFDETIDFFQRLEAVTPMLHNASFGTSAQGRDLSLVIIDKDGLTTPDAIRAKGRIIILVESCIHSGEPDGKDACMIYFRDMLLKGLDKDLLNDVSFILDPVFNVDGHEDFRATNRINQNGPEELGTRNNALLMNLNRDFLKTEAPEMKAWHRMYNYWDPELFIDCHVTNGADFQYVMTYSIENYTEAMAPTLRRFATNIYEKQLNQRMSEAGFPMFPYCEYNRTYAPELGASLDSFDPRYSTSYAAFRNRLGLLLETHIYKPYKERVQSTIEAIRHSARILAENKKDLRKAIQQDDAYVASTKFRAEEYPLTYKLDTNDSIIVDYLGWERDTVISDLSGGKWVRHRYDKPHTYHIPLFTKHLPATTVKVPEAYIIMPQYSNVAEILELNGLKLSRIEKATSVEVETYRYTGAVFSKHQSEGRVPVVSTTYTTQTETLVCPAGSYYLDMNQPNAKLALYALEPNAPGSLTYWGYFNASVEPTNEFWIRLSYMEEKGRELLATNPEIKAQFEAKKKADKEFASNPDAILNFFYDIVKKQSHQDNEVHPVWRVMK